MICVGIDWGERHHDACIVDSNGQVLVKGRVADGLAGLRRIQELIGRYATETGEVVVGVETDRSLLVAGRVASGYHVDAINPFAASRYRDRHVSSGAKSDVGH